MSDTNPWHARMLDALKLLPDTIGRRSAGLFGHGTLRIRFYAPRQFDPQEPHDQDEVYVVMSGSGVFHRGEESVGFAAGDVLFVPAGMPHRFASFSDDFTTWVVFYGPTGGEKKA